MKNNLPVTPFVQIRAGGIAFLLVLFAMAACKAIDEGWFTPREPLNLGNKPALLFFNRYKGCECELVVYRAAELQIENWPADKRHGIQLISINLDRRPDLGQQFNIVRAPNLLLLDQDGETVYRQNEIITDQEPLDLVVYEERILEVVSGE